MTTTEILTLGGLFVSTIVSLITVIKVLWGSAASYQSQLSLLKETCDESATSVRNDLLARLELQTANIGNVTSNISDRIHGIEIKTMEFRAIAAETYMRRDAYHKATDEFKRDVRDAHDDLRAQMQAGFAEVKEQIGAVSMSIEENRRARRQD